jgi:hypothetical protein
MQSLPPDSLTSAHQQLMFALSNLRHLPVINPYRYWAAAGGYLSYGSDRSNSSGRRRPDGRQKVPACRATRAGNIDSRLAAIA